MSHHHQPYRNYVALPLRTTGRPMQQHNNHQVVSPLVQPIQLPAPGRWLMVRDPISGQYFFASPTTGEMLQIQHRQAPFVRQPVTRTLLLQPSPQVVPSFLGCEANSSSAQQQVSAGATHFDNSSAGTTIVHGDTSRLTYNNNHHQTGFVDFCNHRVTNEIRMKRAKTDVEEAQLLLDLSAAPTQCVSLDFQGVEALDNSEHTADHSRTETEQENPTVASIQTTQTSSKKRTVVSPTPPDKLASELNEQQLRTRPRKYRSWDDSYRELVEFKARYGHTQVPVSVQHDPLVSTEEEARDLMRLGMWVSQQRSSRHRGKLSEFKTELLEKLGFTWQVLELSRDTYQNPLPRRSWDDSYKDLVAFKKLHGHTMVPRRGMKGNEPHTERLGAWVNRQRDKYRKGKLTKTEVDQLNSIGFVWDAGEFAGRKGAKRARLEYELEHQAQTI